jgi:hypothetical protein
MPAAPHQLQCCEGLLPAAMVFRKGLCGAKAPCQAAMSSILSTC